MSVSWEVATLCPRCGQTGERTLTKAGPRRGVKIHTLTCKNGACRWYETSWVVQTNEDGSIPERPAGEKEYPRLDPVWGKQYIERLQADLDRKTGPGRQ